MAASLCLAAAPTFALMALVSAILGDDPAAVLCAPPHGASPLAGMTAMYLLMSVFHAAPWLRLLSRRRRRGGAGSLRSAQPPARGPDHLAGARHVTGPAA